MSGRGQKPILTEPAGQPPPRPWSNRRCSGRHPVIGPKPAPGVDQLRLRSAAEPRAADRTVVSQTRRLHLPLRAAGTLRLGELPQAVSLQALNDEVQLGRGGTCGHRIGVMLDSCAMAKGHANRATKLELLQGTLELMVLQTLDTM